MFGWLLRSGKRKRREQCIFRLADILNHQEYAKLNEVLTEDVVFEDFFEDRIEGLEDFIYFEQRFRNEAGNAQIIIESFDHIGEDVRIRGCLRGGSRDINARTIWKGAFRGNRVCRIEVMREDSQRTLPAYANAVAKRTDLPRHM